MLPFTYKCGRDPWPRDLTLLHAYVLPDLRRNAALAALIGACRVAVRGEPLAHVPDEWLHVTLCQIAVPAWQIAETDRTELAAAIGERVAGVTAFTVTAGNPLCVPTGILIDIADAAGLLEGLRDLVTAAIAAVLGPDTPLSGDTSPLHLTESYAYGEADDERVRARLGSVSSREAPLPVDAVELVDVSVNQATKAITWKQVARIPLGVRG